MLFKIHKIRNVEKTVCCAEQKLAYNIAFYRCLNYRDQFMKFMEKKPFRGNVLDAINKIVNISIETFPEIDTKKFNIDVIYMILKNNLENFLLSGRHILCSYEEIGEYFSLPEGYEYI